MDPSGQRASTAWTPQEDQTLLHARAQGLNWAPIQAAHFPTKTPNACRKRHERLIEKRNVDDWGGERFEDLARHYMEARRDMWSLLGARVGEKWQIVESKCMERGLKNLQAAGRSALRKERIAAGLDPARAGGDEGDDPMDTASELDPSDSDGADTREGRGGFGRPGTSGSRLHEASRVDRPEPSSSGRPEPGAAAASKQSKSARPG